jgi:hypothetical protein
MRVSQAIGSVLVDSGIEAFFGLAGSGNFAVLSALHAEGAAFYSARHECGAVMMADGYARASRKVGVASVHQGPGFTNTLTGLAEAAKARTPLIVLAADIPTGTLWSNFKVDQAALAATVGAIAERVRGPETAAADTARALRRAQTTGRSALANAEAAGSGGGFCRRGRGPARSLAPACHRRGTGRRPRKRARGARGAGRPGWSRARDERDGARALYRQPLLRRDSRRFLLLTRRKVAG